MSFHNFFRMKMLSGANELELAEKKIESLPTPQILSERH